MKNLLSLHPSLTPFIGNHYGKKPKVLFIGESHFLPSEYNNTIGAEWDTQPTTAYNFTAEALAYLNTRDIIRHDVIEATTKNSSHSIYRNIGNVYGEVFVVGDYRSALEYIAFSNYFLRPAEECGGSISILNWEEEVTSYRHLVTLNAELRPKAIIFVSQKARQSLHRVLHSPHIGAEAEDIKAKVYAFPHPSCRWWNTPAKPTKTSQELRYLKKCFLIYKIQPESSLMNFRVLFS